MKKIFLLSLKEILLLSLVFLFGLTIIAFQKPKIACAAYWGCSYSDSSHMTCPQTGAPVPVCMSSININVGIISSDNSLPANTRFTVDMYADQLTCSNVTCLARRDMGRTYTYPNNGGSGFYSDKIGCSGTNGNCWVNGQDILNVNVYAQSLPAGTTCANITYVTTDGTRGTGAIAKLDIANGNGADTSVVFDVKCTAASTPTPTPPACIVPGKPVPVMTCIGCTK